MKSSIIIIPNEHVLNVPIYSANLDKKEPYHGKKIRKFSEANTLEITPKSLGISEDSYVGISLSTGFI